MLTIILISFLAGILTVLAPCVLPLLPVILGGGLAGTSRRRPYIIIVSLMASLMLFTFLLKASTFFIDIDPKVWDFISGGLLIVFGMTLIFPRIWSWFVGVTGIEHWSQNSLQSASEKEGIWGPIGIGAALGPVFSSCNPTYSLLLATILPLDIVSGIVGLLAYFIGLGLILLLVTLFGRSILSRFTFFANPNGLFRRILGVIILMVGILVTSGIIKNLQTYVVENGNFTFLSQIEEGLNEKIDTTKIQTPTQQPMMCTGKNCNPSSPLATDIAMDIYHAPEIVGVENWINLPVGQTDSDHLTLASLRGKVVLIDFWTYSCINCKRTQPYLNAWHDKYEKDGLVIIGIHAPEFAFEKLPKNVAKAVKEANIKYPVALDNEFQTWNAYANRYWPAKYLIDQKGNIVYKHFGEGEYAATEKKIQELLGKNKEENGVNLSSSRINNEDRLLKNGDTAPLIKGEQKGDFSGIKTPETYLGSARAKNRVGNCDAGICQGALLEKINQWTISNYWSVTPEYIESLPLLPGSTSRTTLSLRFSAKKVFLVVSMADGVKKGVIIKCPLDKGGGTMGAKEGDCSEIQVTTDDLYTVFESDIFQTDQTILIEASPGLRLHAFTFGG